MGVVAEAARAPAISMRFPAKWYFAAIFLGVPVWWLLGIETFAWPLFVLPLGVALLLRRGVTRPRWFGLWVVFLLWVLASATQLDGADRLLAFTFRASLYLTATVLFLYVFNADRRELPTHVVVNVMVGLAALVVACAYLSLLLPDVRLATPAKHLLPAGLADNEFIDDAVHANFAAPISLANRHVRPIAPFRYPNEWGSTFGLLVPFVLLALAEARSRARQVLLGALLVAAIVPVLATVNRGLWLALAVAVAYVGVRFARARRRRPLVFGAAFVAVTIALAFATGFNSTAGERLHADQSTQARQELYKEAGHKALGSPLLGYGAPRPSQYESLPSVGTHGQFFLVLVSHGLPAVLFFFGWLAYSAARFRHLDPPVTFWAHIAMLIFFVESLYYELLPLQLLLSMVFLGLAWRELARPRLDGEPA
jgi:hypothetical protein